jgi:hypothetical protein
MRAERGSMNSLVRPFLFSLSCSSCRSARADAPAQKPDGSAKPAAVAGLAPMPITKLVPRTLSDRRLERARHFSDHPVRTDGKISCRCSMMSRRPGSRPCNFLRPCAKPDRNTYFNPRSPITVTEINSRRVYITGEVTQTGSLPLLPNMTVLQALSSAGGFIIAKLKNIYVLRNETASK